VELLRDDSVLGIDSADDRRGEESKTLDSDVVQKEDERSGQNDRVENAADRLLLVELINNLALPYTFRLDASDSKILFLLIEPTGCLRAVGKGEERDYGKNARNDALDSENHPPALEATERVESEDRRGK
jgi:hypothetical protein